MLSVSVYRTVQTIVEEGSFTKAADRLGLSQPGVSAQVRKVESVCGGPVLAKVGARVELTALGTRLMDLATRIVDTNDQILRIGGDDKAGAALRVGLSDLFAKDLMRALQRQETSRLVWRCASANQIIDGLEIGYFDAGCLLDAPDQLAHVMERWEEPVAWVCSRSFALRPGKALPIIASSSLAVDRAAISILDAAGLAYEKVFTSFSWTACIAAAVADMGLMALPARTVPRELVLAPVKGLPSIPPLRAAFCCRNDLEPGLSDLRGVLGQGLQKARSASGAQI